MRILMIGNGFDLAHSLPTKYTDFLAWIQAIQYITNYENASKDVLFEDFKMKICEESKVLQDEIRTLLEKNFIDEIGEYSKEILECISENHWIQYFMEIRESMSENWIDFEAEISEVIQMLQEDMKNKTFKDAYLESIEIKYFHKKFINVPQEIKMIDGKQVHSFITASHKNLHDILLKDLDRLIRCLEIYLEEYVSKIEINSISNQIEELQPNKVLSFNYTSTYQKIYENNIEKIEYDYIHGKADINNSIESDNMILGIDEYLCGEDKNKHTEYIQFKKFYQRIHKETGSIYLNWLDEIYENYKEGVERERSISPAQRRMLPNEFFYKQNELFIFGHSLDKTDGDVIRDLIMAPTMNTFIFYKDAEQHGQQIANLVNVIGQEEVIKRTGGKFKSIKFIKQDEFVKRQ